MPNLSRCWAYNCSWVIAGANFIASRRRGVVFLYFLSLFFLHGATRSLSGRRLGNPRVVVEKWAPDHLSKDKWGLKLMNLDGAGPILHDFQCRISWSLWFGRLWGAHSGSRTPFTIWNARIVISRRKLVS